MERRQSIWVYLLLILPPLFWAGNSVLARGVADLIPPVALSFWRWCLALLILLPLTRKQLVQDWPVIVANRGIIFVLGLLGIASFNTLLYTAAHTTTAINIALTQAVMPAIILLISYLFFRDKVTRLQLTAVMLCVLGAGYIVIQGDLQRLLHMQFVSGDLIMLLAVILYAFYSVLLRKRPAIHPLSLLTCTFAVGTVLLLPLYLWERQDAMPLLLTGPVIASLLYVATCPSILAYLYWNRGVAEIGANRAGLYINLIPLFASLLAVLLLNERFQSFHLIGILFICSGLLLFNLPLGRRKEKQ